MKLFSRRNPTVINAPRLQWEGAGYVHWTFTKAHMLRVEQRAPDLFIWQIWYGKESKGGTCLCSGSKLTLIDAQIAAETAMR